MVRKRGNNEGSIRKRADGRYEARITLPDGNRKSYFGRTRREVQEKMTAGLRDVHRGIPIPVGRQTLGRFLERWLTESVRPRVRPKTYRSYEQLIRVHIVPALGRLPLEQVTPQRIETFLNEKRSADLSSRTIQYLHAVLRAALNRAVKWNLIGRNPATLVDSPTVERSEVEALTAPQAQAILDAMRGTRLEGLVTVTLALGLRQGEALGLRWRDVDLGAATVAIRHQVQKADGEWEFVPLKTERSKRTLALPVFVVAALTQHHVRQAEERLAAGPAWQDHDLVFPSIVGTPWDGTNVTHEFQKRLAAAGLPRMRFHDLRHGTATLLKSRGTDLREIMAILGHSQIALTANLYTHIAPEVRREAAAKMDAIFGVG